MKKNQQEQVAVWTVDGMDKVFADTAPPEDASARIALAAAAGECEVAQIAVRAGADDTVLHKPEIDALKSADHEILQKHVTARFVELVPVRFQSQGIPRDELVRAAPDFFPDPLCLEDRMVVPAGQTRSIWLCVDIPRNAAPGRYACDVTVVTSAGERRIAVTLTVWPFSLPAHIPFDMTWWVRPALIARRHCVGLYSEDFWRIIDAYAANMAAHRQNTIFTTIMGRDSLIAVTKTKSGDYRFDFTRFDRWVELFLKHGFQLIEGGHIVGNGPRYAFLLTDEATGEKVLIEKRSRRDRLYLDEEYIAVVEALLAVLRDHLKNRGWDKRYLQHIFDEPAKGKGVENYLTLAALVREIWPDVRLIDAADADPAVFEADDVLVPLVDHRSVFQDARKYLDAGKTLWCYTANLPRGRYPGVFLDQPLIKTRIIPWVMWRYGATGFLYYCLGHWETQYRCEYRHYNPYEEKSVDRPVPYDPWVDPAMNATWQCPPGSWGVVYPPREPQSQDPATYTPDLIENYNRVRDGLPSDTTQEGPAKERTKEIKGVVDSIRWEQMREGIEDYGLLCLLSESIARARKNPALKDAAARAEKALDAIVMEVAPDWQNYTREPSDICEARRRIAEEIERLAALEKGTSR